MGIVCCDISATFLINSSTNQRSRDYPVNRSKLFTAFALPSHRANSPIGKELTDLDPKHAEKESKRHA
jgi:hypothetical protein